MTDIKNPSQTEAVAADDAQHNLRRHEAISNRARELWIEQGQPSNRDLEIWLEAERLTDAEIADDPEMPESMGESTAPAGDVTKLETKGVQAQRAKRAAPRRV